MQAQDLIEKSLQHTYDVHHGSLVTPVLDPRYPLIYTIFIIMNIGKL